MSIELKIKSKHLSEEARIIRFSEQKLLKTLAYKRKKHKETGTTEPFKEYVCSEFQQYLSLKDHRKVDVAIENRATFLARAYLSGKLYCSIEQKRLDVKEHDFWNFVFPRIVSMVARYLPNSPYRKYDYKQRRWVLNNDTIHNLEIQIKNWINKEKE